MIVMASELEIHLLTAQSFSYLTKRQKEANSEYGV